MSNKIQARLAQFSAYRGMQMGLFREKYLYLGRTYTTYVWYDSVDNMNGQPIRPLEDLLATTPAARHMTSDVFPRPVEGEDGVVRWDWRCQFEHLPDVT